MKIFGNPMSTCTRKVLATANELGTPYELVVIDFGKGEHKQPAHLAHQPFGQVPAIDDEGFQLYESRAISRYLNDKVGGKLMGHDVRSRAQVEQWISVETSNYTNHAMKFVYHEIFKRAQTPEVLEAARTQLERALDVMETQLAAHPFIAGDSYSLADICFSPYFEYTMHGAVKAQVEARPHVAAWWTKVSDRPAWKKTAGR